MARDEAVNLAPAVVTELTNADVSGALTFINRSGYEVLLRATTDATPPTAADFAKGIAYNPNCGERDVTLDEIFTNATGHVRLWAYAPNGGRVVIMHP